MIDPDARIWCSNGAEMTVVEMPPRGKCRADLVQWLNKNTDGEYVITPYLVGFEFGQEATLFKLGFR